MRPPSLGAPVWRATLRIARREAWRSKGRSLLVVALIGLPIFVLAGADIVYRTWQLDPGEKITRQLGTADASLTWIGEPVNQTPAGDELASNQNAVPAQSNPAAPPTTAQVLARLPQGSRLIENRAGLDGVKISTAAGLKISQLTGLNYADPLARGLVDPVSGRAPATDHEVALTTALAHSTGLRVGATLRAVDPTRTLTVVGLVTDASYRKIEAAYVLPGAIGPSPAEAGGVTWLAHTPAPVSWNQVQALNRLGYLVTSRSVYLHHPPKSQVPVADQTESSSVLSRQAATSAALVAGMALLEIVLLAGPAFAVGARRQRRDLALVAAVGGRRRDLRNVVLSSGIVLGLAAGVVSVVGAVVAAAIGVPLLGDRVDQIRGHFDLRPLELALLVLVGLATALAAAAFPARGAARTDVIAALSGRRGVLRSARRVPLLGVVAVALGTAISLGGLNRSTGATVILAGVALVELGLIACTPTLLGLLGRLGSALPVSGRIALRDTSRNRSTAAPAVAAVMASVIGAIAIVLTVASSDDQSRRGYVPSMARNDAYVDVGAQPASVRGAVVDVLRDDLPSTAVVVVNAPASDRVDFPAPGAPPVKSISAMLEPTAGAPSRYLGGAFPSVVVDDGSAVEALINHSAPQAVRALRAGEAVVLDGPVNHGQAAVALTSSLLGSDNGAAPAADTTRVVKVAAIAFDQGFPASQLVLPPAMATRLGLGSTPTAVLALNDRQPSDHEQQTVRGALQKLDPNLYLQVETGYHDPNIWRLYALIAAAAIIAVGAAIIATALANVDSRPDLITLGAVGASPRTRRVLSMSRALVIAGIGTVLGTAAGFVPALAWIGSQHRAASQALFGGGYIAGGIDTSPVLRLVVPWGPVTTTVLAIPLLAAAVAVTLTRSGLPSERRSD